MSLDAPIAAVVSRAVLALVLGVAAVGKWRDPAGTRTGAVELGVPSAALGLVAAGLPLAEAAAAVLLLVPATARLGAAAALVLLGLLTAALGRAVAAGRRPRCHCFGARSDRPAGPEALVRNAALLALGAVALLG